MCAFLNVGLNSGRCWISLDIYGLQLIPHAQVFHLSLGRDGVENPRDVHETFARAATASMRNCP